MSVVDAAQPPGRVKVAGGIMYVEAALTVVAAVGMALPAALFGDTNRPPLLLVTVLLLAIGAVTGVLAVFLLQGRQWARIATLTFSVVWILVGVLLPGLRVVVDAAPGQDVLRFEGSRPDAADTSVLVNVVIVWLLGTAPARRFFRDPRGGQARDAMTTTASSPRNSP